MIMVYKSGRCPTQRPIMPTMFRSLGLFLLYFYFYSLTLLAQLPCTDAAHSRKRVATRTRVIQVYDRSITTFDPAGRLLQVEYGLQAAQRGSPLVAVIFNNTIYVGMKELETTSVTAMLPIHRLDHHLFLLTSGLAGDGLALANELRANAIKHRLMYGESSTVQECATQAATIQHSFTKLPGARTLGVTGLVVGFEPSSPQARLYRSQPGGTLEDCWYTTAGQQQDTTLAKWHILYPTVSSPTDVVRGLIQTLHEAQSKQSNDNQYQVWILRPPQQSEYNANKSAHISCLHGLTRSVSDQDLQEALSSILEEHL